MTRSISGLADAVRDRRVALNLRQTDLAELAGCSTRFVHTLEQAKETVRLDKLLDVLEVLGLGLRVVPGRGNVAAATHDDSTKTARP